MFPREVKVTRLLAKTLLSDRQFVDKELKETCRPIFCQPNDGILVFVNQMSIGQVSYV